MKVIYESKRPRYVVQRCSDMSDWEDERGYDDLKKARIDADNARMRQKLITSTRQRQVAAQ